MLKSRLAHGRAVMVVPTPLEARVTGRAMRKVLLVVMVVTLVFTAGGCGGDVAQPELESPPDAPLEDAGGGPDDDGQVTPSATGPRRCGQVAGEGDVYRVGEAGQVELRHEGDTLELVEVRPADGWDYRVDDRDDDDEVEVTFRGNGREVEFEAEVDDGRLEVEICD